MKVRILQVRAVVHKLLVVKEKNKMASANDIIEAVRDADMTVVFEKDEFDDGLGYDVSIDVGDSDIAKAVANRPEWMEEKIANDLVNVDFVVEAIEVIEAYAEGSKVYAYVIAYSEQLKEEE